MKPRLNTRFWTSTRGRVVVMLRCGSQSVNDLAEALSLTDNAVRAHLTALERDGLVRQTGTRPGARKPTTTYGLTPEAEQLFPKGYAPVFRQFLDVLKERAAPEEVKELARAVGRRMASGFRAVAQGDPPDALDHALTVLRELGGFCDSERREGGGVLRCSDCPLSAVVAAHPEVCLVMEALLAEVLGVPVRERCQVGETPHCVFEITAAGG